MKLKNNYNLTSFFAGLILIALGIAYYLLQIGSNLISLIFINSGLILAVISVLKFNKLGAGLKQDERTRQLSSTGLAYSWLTTFVVLNILFWIDWLKIYRFNLAQGVSLTIFVMIISASIFKWRLNNKGYHNEK